MMNFVSKSLTDKLIAAMCFFERNGVALSAVRYFVSQLLQNNLKQLIFNDLNS